MNEFPVGRYARKVRLFCLPFLVTTAGQTSAQELHVPADARLHNLSALYQRDVPANVAGICSQRFAATHNDWDLTVSGFKARNKVQLAELDVLQARILSALKTGHPGPLDIDTWAAVVNARSEQQLLVGYMLAPLSDRDAQSYCDQARKSFSEEVIDEETLKTARAAVAAAVEDLSAH